MKIFRRFILWFGSLLLFCLGLCVFVLIILATTQFGARKSVQMASTWLKVNAEIELSVDVASGTLLDGLILENLTYRSGLDSAQFNRLTFSWQPWRLLDKQLQINTLRLEGLRWQSSPAPNVEQEAFDVESIKQLFAQLPITVSILEFGSQQLNLNLDGTEIPIPELAFAASLDEETFVLNDFSIELFDVGVQGRVSLKNNLLLDGALNWQYGSDALYAGELFIAGDLLQMSLEHELTTPFQVESVGELNTGLLAGSELAISFQHDASEVNLAEFGQENVSLSSLRLSTVGSVADIDLVGAFVLDAFDFAPAALAFSANYSPDELALESLSIESAELSVEAKGEYFVNSKDLSLNWSLGALDLPQYFSGMALENIRGDGRLELNVGEQLSARVELGPLQGELNNYPLSARGSLQIESSVLQSIDLDISSGGNTLLLNGMVQPELTVSWNLSAPALEQLWTSLSGTVNGSGQLAGNVENPLLLGSLQGDALALEQGDSIFHLQTISINANAARLDNELLIQLTGIDVLNSDKNSIDGEPLQLLESARLELNGNLQQLELNADISGLDSQVSFALQAAVDAGDWRGQVSAAEIRSPYGDWLLQDAMSLHYNDAAYGLGVNCWSFLTTSLCFEGSAENNSGLNANAHLVGLPLSWLNSQNMTPSKPAGLENLQATYDLQLPQGLRVDGLLDGDFEIKGFRDAAWNDLQVQLRPQSLKLELLRQIESDTQTIAPEIQRINVDEVSLNVSNQQGIWTANTALRVSQELESLDADVDLITQGVQGRFSAEVQMDAQESLQGEMLLMFDDMSWLEIVFPLLHETDGELQGNVLISGTRQEPVLHSQLNLNNGRFTIPDYGLDVKGISFRVDSSDEVANIALDASSGEGEIKLEARLLNPLMSTRSLSAQIQGDNFTVANMAAAEVTISPDLDISWEASRLDIGGSFIVPKANVKIEEWLGGVQAGAVSPSRDAVVVNADPEALVVNDTQVVPIKADLMLALGDEVKLSGFGLDARLTGGLNLQQEYNRPLLVNGELGVTDGFYRLYNQELQINNGRLLFYGNPLNPILDVKAERKTTTAEVGMLLSGSLNKIQGSLYSTPSLPENEILSLLITGKTFGNMDNQDGDALISAIANFGIEKGEGLTSMIGDKLGLDTLALNSGSTYQESALGVGKYLTPDLLMSYEIGLFDRQAAISLEYTLSQHLKLEVKSGLSQSVDVTYTIEKD